MKVNWEITANRFIGFFDIMGFSDFVYSNNHEKVINRMNELHDIISKFKRSETIESIIKPVIFSDSILLISKDSSEMVRGFFITLCSWFLGKCLQKGIPIKGAISYGTITADFEKSIYFGKPLIDAYKLQEELNLYGCVIEHKAEIVLEEEDKESLIYGKVPLKTGSVNHYCINWTGTLILVETEMNLKSYIDIIKKYYTSSSGSIRKYVDNTIEFLENNKAQLNIKK